MGRAIQFTGTNAQEVGDFLERECWVKCSGDLAVKITGRSLCDEARVETVPLGWWVANTDSGIEKDSEGF